MKLKGLLPSQRTRTVSAFSALTVTLTVLAILHDGTEVADLDLHDGGVWVTNRNLNGLQVAAHLNYPSRQLDANTKSIPGAGMDLSQEANAVVISNHAHQLSAVDTATWAVDPVPAQLGDAYQSSQGSDVVAISDPNKGKVWAVSAAEVAGFDAESTKPVLGGAVGVRAVVGKDDVIHTVVPSGTLRDLRRKGDAWVAEEVGSVPEIEGAAMQSVTMAAVGRRGVVFNPVDGWVAWPGHETSVDGAKALVLQQSGSDTGSIALAGPSGLVRVPLDGGDPETIPAPPGGTAIAPVTVGDCAYAAWAGTGTYLRDCTDDSQDVAVAAYPQLKPNEELVFRTNRDVVVLNDPTNGDIFLVNEAMLEISDWDAVLANLNQDEKDQKDETVAVTERSETNTPPKPKDDDFGVRPGQSVTLPVLANDLDADGDLLTARLKATEVAGVGQLELVRDGRAIRVSVDEEARPGATSTFTYLADDGRKNGTAEASVALKVRGERENSKVEPLVPGRQTKLSIRARSEGEQHVLGEWKDPDGDPFWVSKVEYGEGLSGTYRPDGLIRVRDGGNPDLPRERMVKVTLTDGRPDGARTVDLPVVVLPVESKDKPVAHADFVTTLAADDTGDHAVTVRPLHNDTDPNGDDLYLSLVGKVPPTLAVTTNEDQSLTITSKKAGTEYLEYSITDGGPPVTSVVRVDTLAAEAARPVPDNDLAVLPPHGEVLVDVLSNDTDPLGGVLVVESVDVGQETAVTAEVVDHEVIKLTDVNLVEGTSVDISYEVGNGLQTGTGTVTVVLDPARKPSAPVAADDAAVVRSGDVVTVDVLDNDMSPTDLPLEVLPLAEDAVTEGAELGEAWVSENKVRVRATGEEGLVRVQYTVRDTGLRTHSATVVLTVVPVSGANSAPSPRPLTGRLVQGGEAEVVVPLEGIDPDGDSVSLVGLDIANPPRKGSVSFAGDTMTYQAAGGEENRGTDGFSYVVEDEFGRQATGEVRIGIAAPPSSNLPPLAQVDQRRVKPGRVVAVPVTANDIDPEGGALTIVGDVEQARGPSAEAEVVEGRVRLTTPDEEGTLVHGYRIRDDLGAESQSTLSIEVDEDADALPPVARDDRVPVADVLNQETVTVDVLRNDEDPDGSITELTPEIDTAGVDVTSDGQLVIPVRPERQVIVYRLTDPDDQVGKAVVVVPGSESPAALRPALRPDAELPIEVDAGTSADIPLDEYVVVREGREPSLPFTENVIAGPGHDGSDLKVDEKNLAFGAKDIFHGPTSVVATVSDTKGDDDADALVSTLTIPVFVNASGNAQPDLRVPAITVAPQEPWEGDLRLLASDPDSGDADRLEFEAEEIDPGLSVEIDNGDGTITVRSESGTRPGTYQFDLTVTDGSTAEVRRTAIVTVVESTRDKISVADVEMDVQVDDVTRIDIADYVTHNPFEDDGKPVELVGEPRVTAGEVASVDVDVLTVAIRPKDDFHGTISATYLLQDATGLADRQVQGQITLNVRGYPSPPTTILADASNAQVEVDWNGAEPNGAPITGYKVVWEGEGGSGSAETSGPQTTYTVKGLTNGRSYRFQVFAINEVGESKTASPWSREVVPDDVPETPANVEVSFDNGKLHVTWTQPDYDGTPVERYEVSYNGAILPVGTALKATLPGLQNGKPYKVRVRGINAAENAPHGTPGASAWSAVVTEHPNGEPAVTSVSIDADGPDADPTAVISWTYDDHGHPVANHEVRRANGAVAACPKLTETSCRVALLEGEQSRFQVRLFNRPNPKVRAIDGWGEWSAATNAVRGAKPPGPVANLRVTPTGSNNTARVEFGAANLHGAESASYHYRIDGGGGGAITSGDTIGGLPNGQNRRVTVWAVTTANGKQSAPGPEESRDVNVYGACTGTAWTAGNGYQTVKFGYRVQSHGRPCTWSGDASGSIGANQGSGDRFVDKSGAQGASVSFGIAVRTDENGGPKAAGEDSQNPSASGRTWDPSAYQVRHNGGCTGVRNPPAGCQKVEVRLLRWQPGRRVMCTAPGVGGYVAWRHTYVVGSDGSTGWESSHDGGGHLFDSQNARFADGENTGEFTCT